MLLETLYWRGSTRSEESPHTQRCYKFAMKRVNPYSEQLVLFLTTGRKLYYRVSERLCYRNVSC